METDKKVKEKVKEKIRPVYAKPLAPIHSSRRHHFPARLVQGMDRLKVSPDQLEWLDTLVLGIFTDMSNSGSTFAQILGAIYLSGLNHAVEAIKEKPSIVSGLVKEVENEDINNTKFS